MNNAVKKLIPLLVEGAKVLDICLEGDKLIEAGTGGVYNKSVKGVKIAKGPFKLVSWFSCSIFYAFRAQVLHSPHPSH